MGFFSRLYSFANSLLHPVPHITFSEEQRTPEQLQKLLFAYLDFVRQSLSDLTVFCVDMNTSVFVDQNFLVGLTEVDQISREHLAHLQQRTFLTVTDFHILTNDEVLSNDHKDYVFSHLILSDAKFKECSACFKKLQDTLTELTTSCKRLQSLDSEYTLASDILLKSQDILFSQVGSIFSLHRFVNRKIAHRVPRPAWFNERCRIEYWHKQQTYRELSAFLAWMQHHVVSQVA